LAAAGGGKPFHLTRMLKNTPLLPYETFSYAPPGRRRPDDGLYNSTRRAAGHGIVVIHGGSWRGGNSQQLPELNSELARQGFHVATINYRLAPIHKSCPVEDIALAISYLKDNEPGLRSNNNFILLGRSAGCTTSQLIAAYTLDMPGIRGVVNFLRTYDWYGLPDPANPLSWILKSIEDFLGGPYSEVPRITNQIRPVE